MTTQRRAQHSTNPLLQLREFGQAVWLDFLSRKFIADGGLQKLVEHDGLTGAEQHNPPRAQAKFALRFHGIVSHHAAHRRRGIHVENRDLQFIGTQLGSD